MSYRLMFLLTWLASAFLRPVCAAEPLTEAQLERLVQESPKLHLPELIAFNEGKLERIYQAKLQAADPEYRAALQKSQEAWRKFYEADLVVGALDTRGGSGQAVFAMERHVYQLRLRIYQLSTDFLQGWAPIPKVDEPAPKHLAK
ncbi:MAG: lysozyme inhibitor LprI family protein [Chthoniobacter sp.]|uniref:lysozyme inhibitor LprI family protein n=1 Tax=Chthoniobacter sp. TaxID=2510640 RepID=UPI0032AB61BC